MFQHNQTRNTHNMLAVVTLRRVGAYVNTLNNFARDMVLSGSHVQEGFLSIVTTYTYSQHSEPLAQTTQVASRQKTYVARRAQNAELLL